MKNRLFSFSTLLCLLICGFKANAQTITYTINTNNVSGPLAKLSSGLPTIPPSTGTIVNGDNIAMPWVNPGNTTNNTGYTFTISGLTGASPTNFQWSVSGDLAIVGSSTGTTVKIIHANSLNRGGLDRGQSKGRVTFYYTYAAAGCSTLVSIPVVTRFDVFKQFAGTNDGTVMPPPPDQAVPPIVGPDCILPNRQYTYSVDPVVSDNIGAQIGIDRYFWDAASLAAIGATVNYYSNDSSSITFTTGATVPTNYTLTCGIGAANYPPLQTTASLKATAVKTLQASAGIPTVTVSGAATGTISTSTPLCINTNGSTVTPLTFSVAAQPGATYAWTFGTVGAFGTGSVNNWNTSPAQSGTAPYTVSGNSLTIANIFNQPGVVTLTVTDACGVVTNYHYQVKRTLTAADAALISISNNCLTPGGSAALSIANSANLNTLTWAPLTNWTLNATTISPGASVAPGTYTVNASFSGCSSSVPYTIRVRPAAVAITAPSPLCFPVSTSGNSVTASPAGSGYTWSTTAGSISGTTNVASLTTGTTSPFTISATYTVAAGCATSGSATAYLASATPLVNLPSCIGSGVPGATTALTVTNYPGYGTYTLTFVSGTNIVSGSGSTGGTINVTLNGASGSGVYAVSHSNGSCTSASTNVTLSTNTAPFTVSPLYVGPTFAIIGASSNTLNYAWYNCTSGALLGNTSSPTTTWQLNTPQTGANNDFGAQALVGGCVYRVCTNVPGYAAKTANGGTHPLPTDIGSVYPNPSHGEFAIDLKHVSRSASAVVYDMNGKMIYKADLVQGINKIADLNITSGNYLVTLLVDGTYYTKTVAVTKQ